MCALQVWPLGFGEMKKNMTSLEAARICVWPLVGMRFLKNLVMRLSEVKYFKL